VRGVVNVRAGRSTDFPVALQLAPGDVVKAAFPKDGWYAVFGADTPVLEESRALGYVLGRLLLPVPDASAPVRMEKPEAVSEPVPEPSGPVLKVMERRPWGSVLWVRATTILRRERSDRSRDMGKLDQGVRIKADFPADGWYAVFPVEAAVRDESLALGYARANQFQDTPPLPAAAEPGPEPEPTPEPRKPYPDWPPRNSPAPAIRPPAPKAGTPDEFRAPAPPPSGPALVEGGVKYSILAESAEGRQKAMRILLDARVLPSDTALHRLADALWRRERANYDELRVYIYLPGLDPDGLSYGVAKFYQHGPTEFWTRKSVLYGTRWDD
jgi:hypothetical protein